MPQYYKYTFSMLNSTEHGIYPAHKCKNAQIVGIFVFISMINTTTVSLKTKTKPYSKPCLKQSFKKKTKIGFQDRLSLNAGQKYCRMLQREHSALPSTFNKLPSAIKNFLSIF